MCRAGIGLLCLVLATASPVSVPGQAWPGPARPTAASRDCPVVSYWFYYRGYCSGRGIREEGIKFVILDTVTAPPSSALLLHCLLAPPVPPFARLRVVCFLPPTPPPSPPRILPLVVGPAAGGRGEGAWLCLRHHTRAPSRNFQFRGGML